MGDTAGFFLLFTALLHITLIHFIAEYVNKSRILFNMHMYAEISKRKQGSPCKNSHQRSFETTNFDRLHREE